MPSESSLYVNLGCGGRYHPDFLNLDIAPACEAVQEWNVSAPLPFEDNSVDLLYHSHLLEHLGKCDGETLTRDCHRILKPDSGVIRIVVPDLEETCRQYLRALESSRSNRELADEHEWMIVELVDQLVRERPGGEFIETISTASDDVMKFIEKRIGIEALKIKEFAKKELPLNNTAQTGIRNTIRRLILRIVGNVDEEALRVGQFRLAGEAHKWMYDKTSLARMMEKCGFKDIKEVSCTQSAIPKWEDYLLDNDHDGSPLRPNSIFLEGIA